LCKRQDLVAEKHIRIYNSGCKNIRILIHFGFEITFLLLIIPVCIERGIFMWYEGKKLKVALLLSKEYGHKMFQPDTLKQLRSFADIPDIETLPEKLTDDFLKEAIKGADAAITGWGARLLTEDILKNAPDLKLIGHTAGSIRYFLTDSIWERNIRVFSNTPTMAVDVAETALGLIIVSLKRIWQLNALTLKGLWRSYDSHMDYHGSLEVDRETAKIQRLNQFTTIGIVAASNVGRNLINMLKPFGVRILLYDPFVSEEKAIEMGVVKTTLDELMANSDVVTLAAPKVPETHHMINKDNLKLLKDNAIFINVARGDLVDEDAFINELKTGRIFACVDVTEPEVPAKDNPLYYLENVVLTPHIAGGHSINGRFEHGQYTVDEIYNFFKSGTLKYEITKEMMAVIA